MSIATVNLAVISKRMLDKREEVVEDSADIIKKLARS